MRNRIKTTAVAAAVVAALGATTAIGGFTAASADPGGTPGESAEVYESFESHDEWFDSEEHTRLHDEMADHMSGSMGMGDDMGPGMNGWGDDMESGMNGWGDDMESGMNGLSMGR